MHRSAWRQKWLEKKVGEKKVELMKEKEYQVVDRSLGA